MSMGIVDTEEGQRIILNADGHNIIDVVDKINYSVSGNTRQIAAEALRPVKEAGYISFIVYSTVANENDAYMEIK